MVRKTDITRLLAKGLSGKEAGRLALKQILALERTGEGFLSAKEIAALRVCLRSAAAGDEYERLMDLYRAARLMICEAQIVSLQSERFLRVLISELKDALASPWWAADDAAASGFPVELLTALLAAACVSAGVLVAYRQVIDEAGVVAGVSFLDSWLGIVPPELRVLLPAKEREDLFAAVRMAAKRYNVIAQQVADGRGENDGLRLPTFELDELKPDEATLTILHERLALGVGQTGLGADWWREVS